MLDFPFDPRLSNQPSLEHKRLLADRLLTAWSWKSHLPSSFPAIGCLMGGTGTGKSTIFNSLAGKVISEVSKRRPSTTRPTILAHAVWVDELSNCPFLESPAEQNRCAAHDHGRIEVLQDFDNLELALVDTPDFDSAELDHHLIADNFFLISDFIILIASQEKYADFTAHQVSQKALEWDKRVLFVMNKVSSDAAFEDFRRTLHGRGFIGEPVRIERVDPSPVIIPGLADRDGFTRLFAGAGGKGVREEIRHREMDTLRRHTKRGLDDLIDAIDKEEQRILYVKRRIGAIQEEVVRDMEDRMHAVVSRDTEAHIRNRLQELLRKYDILFVPRMIVRNTVTKAFFSVIEWLGGRSASTPDQADEKTVISEDLRVARSVAKLEPLEAAVARLNVHIADMLCSDSRFEDLCKVARTDVPRWDHEKVRRQYEEAFPGVEQLLEREFQALREGLSETDELKLYGSYTLWAVLLIVVEITVLGGSAMLDALLGTVIMPFIPKWVLNAKVVDLLKDIGLRVEREHRATLRDIVHRQAELYSQSFTTLLPEPLTMQRLREMQNKLQE